MCHHHHFLHNSNNSHHPASSEPFGSPSDVIVVASVVAFVVDVFALVAGVVAEVTENRGFRHLKVTRDRRSDRRMDTLGRRTAGRTRPFIEIVVASKSIELQCFIILARLHGS